MEADTDRWGEARDRYRETERQRQRDGNREEIVSLRLSFVIYKVGTVVRAPEGSLHSLESVSGPGARCGRGAHGCFSGHKHISSTQAGTGKWLFQLIM